MMLIINVVICWFINPNDFSLLVLWQPITMPRNSPPFTPKRMIEYWDGNLIECCVMYLAAVMALSERTLVFGEIGHPQMVLVYTSNMDKWWIGMIGILMCVFDSLQVQIFLRGAQLAKVGGRIVYSTCSFNPVENEAVVAEVLRLSKGKGRIVED
jgi:hypothetical protein